MSDKITEEKKIQDPELAPVTSQLGEVYDAPGKGQDAVFGDLGEDGPKYRNVGWAGTSVLMMKTQVGLGILSIPSAFNTLGMAPGIVILLVVATVTTWSGYVIGSFKLRHPEVYTIDDVGGKIFGRVGREVFGTMFCIFLIFIAGSGMLSLSISFNSMSTHGTCTAVFVAVSAILGFLCASIQTLGRISWLAWVGMISIVAATFTVTIAVSLQGRPASAPQDGPWTSDYRAAGNASFADSMSAVSSIVFAYCGVPGYFPILSEMRDQRYFSRSVVFCQSATTALYLIIGIIIYYYCGSYVASPALGSAGDLMKKISYGLAVPGLIVTTTLYLHLPGKYVFVRLLRGSEHLTANTVIHWATWLGCTFGATLISYIIASAIPVFESLVSLIGALLGTFMCFQPMGMMWLYDNWSIGRVDRSPKWIMLVCWSIFVIVAGSYLVVAGTYGSVISIKEAYEQSGGSAAWSCADNSHST